MQWDTNEQAALGGRSDLARGIGRRTDGSTARPLRLALRLFSIALKRPVRAVFAASRAEFGRRSRGG
jgi:hypothetical protein